MNPTFDTLTDIISRRRSVRIFEQDIDIPQELIKRSLQLAQLAPNSSNLQLWEFYHISRGPLKDKLASACMGQNAAKTASDLVVFVVRRDYWRKHARRNSQHIDQVAAENEKAAKIGKTYYDKLIPFLYSQDPFGFMTFIRRISSWILSIKGPTYRQVTASDQRIIAHKSCALAAENFMLALKAADFDTCPMEGFDSKMVKSLLGLPRHAEINMVIGCGKAKPAGIYGPRFRIGFDECYHQLR